MSHETVHTPCVERVKIAFWTFDWIFAPQGFSRRRTGTLLGTPCWGQKIILNSEYSTRVLFNRAKFFPEGPQRSWFDIFPRFHYCDRILRSTLCKNGHLPHFSHNYNLPLMGCHKETTMIIARGQEKNTLNQLDLSFYHFFPSNVLLVFSWKWKWLF